ncbi:zona pellucida-like domain-containing protein 1 [Astyanax mexicanus]|uniref:Zona pellucida-like domain-containing protein 1 n=1 Tax=Astyanax mexicanus TaxID=7994 RepID=A0A8T2L8X8_ASTMX|nr:zona pellucida-like domain-containing protein 1 [Astyanax mexicanus]
MLLWLCVTVLVVGLQPAHSQYNCSSLYNRVPDNSDLLVQCGVSIITLKVNLCTAQWAGFDPSRLALNGEHNNSMCSGQIDSSVDPPVIRFQLPINDTVSNPCRQSLQIVNEVPSSNGPFSQFSTVQSVIITGYIDTPSSASGVISYSTDLFYHFSCRYPLEYLINNTEIVASSVSVATNDKNGSFIDTLSMSVYNDTDFSYPLVVPSAGLQLRSLVYVEVKAVNLSGNFNLLLDHCFATPTPYNSNSSNKHDFFNVCNIDPRTKILGNGLSKKSRFSFEAFRFVEHRDQDRSTLYLHCILKLCEPEKCQNILNSCSGRKRRAVDTGTEATVSMGPIYTAADLGGNGHSAQEQDRVTGAVVGAVFATAGAVLLVVAGWFVVKKVYWIGGMPHVFK